MVIKIYIDQREKAIFPSLGVLDGVVEYQILTMTTSDYSIVSIDPNTGKETILAVIERKTLADYAASFKDGRHENKQKLINVRNQTQCVIIYIVEGPAYPSINSKFGRIPYNNIHSSMFHLMFRDNIHIIKTKDIKHTVEMLGYLAKSLSTLRERAVVGTPPNTPAAAPITPAIVPQRDNISDTECDVLIDDIFASLEHTYDPRISSAETGEQKPLATIPAPCVPVVVAVDGVAAGEAAPTQAQLIPMEPPLEDMFEIQLSPVVMSTTTPPSDKTAKNMLTEKHEKPIDQVVATMWATFKGITCESGRCFMPYFSLHDIVKGTVTAEQLSAIKTHTSRKFNQSAITGIINMGPDISCKLLAGVPGISQVSAKFILNTYTLKQFLSWDLEAMAAVSMSAKIKVGQVRAKKIKECFEYKSGHILGKQ